MGEKVNERILIKPSLFGALSETLPYVAVVDGAGQAGARKLSKRSQQHLQSPS